MEKAPEAMDEKSDGDPAEPRVRRAMELLELAQQQLTVVLAHMTG
jgi:3-oxoacyl-(acyl-carrier-protein) synthase